MTYKEEVSEQLESLLEQREENKLEIVKLVFDYCKQEGLVAVSLEFDINRPIAYKKIIREEFGLII